MPHEGPHNRPKKHGINLEATQGCAVQKSRKIRRRLFFFGASEGLSFLLRSSLVFPPTSREKSPGALLVHSVLQSCHGASNVGRSSHNAQSAPKAPKSAGGIRVAGCRGLARHLLAPLAGLQVAFLGSILRQRCLQADHAQRGYSSIKGIHPRHSMARRSKQSSSAAPSPALKPATPTTPTAAPCPLKPLPCGHS